MESTKIVVFKGKNIRKTIFKNELWFVISDVIAVLTDSKDSSGYIKDMRRRNKELSKGWGQIATPLLIKSALPLQHVQYRTELQPFKIY